MFLILFVLNFFFIFVFKKKTVFENSVFKGNFISENTKNVFYNSFKKQGIILLPYL